MPVKHLFLAGGLGGTLLLWVVFFSNLLVLYFLINWLPSVLQAAGLPLERAIIGTAVLNAGGIVGGLVLGRFVDRRGPFGVLLAAYALAAGFFVIGTQFCMNALAASFYPTSVRATGVGWALGIGRVGSVIGPVIGGMVLALGWAIAVALLGTQVKSELR